ncbi:ribonuclease III, partial [Acaromyces ingoldii]
SSRLTFSTSSVVQQVAEPSDAPRGRLPPLARIDESLYSAVRPQPLSALSALASRLRLIPLEADEATRKRRLELLVQACTHPSFGKMVREEEAIEQKTPFERQLVAYPANLDNASLSTVGNSLLGMVAAEHLHLRFPNLPTRVLKAAVSAHVGPNTLADVATELGLGGQGILRWDRKARTAAVQEDENGKRFMVIEKQQKLMSRDVMAESMRSIVAVIFQEQGLEVARSFVRNHFLTRLVPLAPLLKFSDPKKTLSETCKKYARERPQSRLIAETGRLSINPIFVVGVWSGQDKLGEGTGSRIKMAEYRAAEDALRRFYLSETPAHELSLPSQTLDREF